MAPFKDITGQVFGRLIALKRTEIRSVGGNVVWLCECECGSLKEVGGGNLNSGNTTSCGCFNTESLQGRVKDLSGQRFGRLAVIQQADKVVTTRTYTTWLCRCDCGRVVTVLGKSLRSGHTESCGCLLREVKTERLRKLHLTQGTHGKAHTPEYKSYHGAKQRCTNPNTPNYADYGGRGIRMMFPSFEEFYAELGERPEPKQLYSVDRYPDNDGPYAVGNVRWATAKQQSNNQRQRRVTA
jgi:hypothetical protein